MEHGTERWHNGLLVRKLRTQAGWQQKQLAVRANCRAETISRWENGSEMPGDVLVRHVARALSIGLEELGTSISEDKLYERLKNSALSVEELARHLRAMMRRRLTMVPEQPPPGYRSLLAGRSPGQAEAESLDDLLSDGLRSDPPGVLVLLGEAGSGKTSALKKQLQDWAHSPRESIERLLLVPVFDVETEWNPHLSPVEAADEVLAHLLRVDVECQPFVRLRSKYRFAFLFDGIDAAATPGSKSRLEALAYSLCSLGQEGVLVLAALRTSLYKDNEVALGGPLRVFRQKHGPQSLRHIHLLPLDRACVRQIAEQYVATAPEYREVGVEAFERWLDESEGVPALAALPFWLIKLLDLYFGKSRRDIAPRLAIRQCLQEAVEGEEKRLLAGEGRLRELLGRMACELFLQERHERRQFPVGSLGSLLRAGMTEEEFQILGSTCFIRRVGDEGGGPPRPLEFRHALFGELFLADHVQGRLCRGDSEFLGRPEIDRTFSANFRMFLDPECLQILEGELLDHSGRNEYNERLELNLIHLLLAHSLHGRHRPSAELLEHLRRRFPIYLQQLYVTEPKDGLCRAVGLARSTSALLDRWERPARGRMVEFVRVLATIPEALLGLAHLSVRYFGSVPQAVERLRVHLAEPLAAPEVFEESVYGVMRLIDLVALYAVIRYHGPSRPDLFEPALNDRLMQLLDEVRDDSQRRLRGDIPRLSSSSESQAGQATQETHRLSCEWLGRIGVELQRLVIRSP